LKNDPTLLGQPVDERLNAEFLMSKKMRIGKSKFKLQYEIDVVEEDTKKRIAEAKKNEYTPPI